MATRNRAPTGNLALSLSLSLQSKAAAAPVAFVGIRLCARVLLRFGRVNRKWAKVSWPTNYKGRQPRKLTDARTQLGWPIACCDRPTYVELGEKPEPEQALVNKLGPAERVLCNLVGEK